MNEAIRAREVRAVFPDGSVEIMQTSLAVRKAQEMGLDLILIAPTAEPPVAKAMDYGQWQYENKKKQHEAKRKQHIIQVKELKFRPNTDDHDYDFKKNHAIRFLTGRQSREGGGAIPRTRNRAHRYRPKAAAALRRGPGAIWNGGRQPRMEGRNAHVLLSPVKVAVVNPPKEKPPKSGPPQAGNSGAPA